MLPTPSAGVVFFLLRALINMCVDLDEVWKVLGLSGCPECTCNNSTFCEAVPACHPRTVKEVTALIRTTRRMLQQPGNVTAVDALLRAHRLLPIHLRIWNPFLLLPHVEFDCCFPPDHLHEV